MLFMAGTIRGMGRPAVIVGHGFHYSGTGDVMGRSSIEEPNQVNG